MDIGTIERIGVREVPIYSPPPKDAPAPPGRDAPATPAPETAPETVPERVAA
jgi:hypothetical protein